jgi:small-conductance mechanosensitive channel
MNFELDINHLKEYALNIGLGLVLLLLVYGGLVLIDSLSHAIKKRLQSIKLRDVKLFGLELINIGKQQLIITTLINGFQVFLSLIFLYFSLVIILSEIPATKDISVKLVDLIFDPIKSFFGSLIAYLPKLFNIIITVVIARYLIKSVKYVSNGVRAGNFQFPGFYSHTALTTAGIISFLIYALTIIIILPNIPGYGSTAFNGIGTLIGVLVTIGGSSVIANYMAGIALTYMHAFEKGDWVEIDGISGQVTVIGAFAISLISYKKETIKIPNSKVLGAAIYNYTGEDKKHMTIYSEVSIGYDVHWKQVNDLRNEAANRTSLLKNPFIFQK